MFLALPLWLLMMFLLTKISIVLLLNCSIFMQMLMFLSTKIFLWFNPEAASDVPLIKIVSCFSSGDVAYVFDVSVNKIIFCFVSEAAEMFLLTSIIKVLPLLMFL